MTFLYRPKQEEVQATIDNDQDAKSLYKIQTKELISDFPSTGIVSDLTFNNLEVGKTYRVIYYLSLYNNTNSSNAIFNGSISGATDVKNWFDVYYSTNQGVPKIKEFSHTFTAIGNTLVFTINASNINESPSSNALIRIGTEATLEELPNYKTTNQWT